MKYVDGFVVAVPADKKDAYREMAAKAAPLFKEFGALRIVECWASDVPDGKVTDIAGLLRDKDDESTLIPEVEVSEIEGYKSAGIIAGGMIPKIGGMADAIYQGVHEAVIIDGRVPHSILLELFSNRGSGTRFYRRSHRE